MSFSASPPKPAGSVLARNAPTGKEEQRGEWITIREPVSNLLYCGLACFRTKSTLKLRKPRKLVYIFETR